MRLDVVFSIWISPTEPWGDARGEFEFRVVPKAGEQFDLKSISTRVSALQFSSTLRVEAVERLVDELTDTTVIYLEPAVVSGEADAKVLSRILSEDLGWIAVKYTVAP